jgi:hypothetical protein
MASRKIVNPVPAQAPVPPAPRIAPRLLRISDTADYLSCTFGFVETLMREGTVKSVILGKRHLCDIRDLDAFIDRIKEEKPA